MKLAFIGLGVMGFPMAGHLAKAGHDVTVFNRSAAKAERWVKSHGGRSSKTVGEAAAGAQVVLMCVGNDQDVREVAVQSLPVMAPGGVIVDHTTASATLARALADEARSAARAFIDAPVSGGQSGAEQGHLSIMVGGDEEPFERIRPVIATYAKAVQYIGASGSGQLTKMVNQIAIAGVVQGLAEALHFAHKAGLDTDRVLAAVSQGAAQSWQMDNRWKTMAKGQYEFGFAVDHMRKDLGLALGAARINGASLPLAALVDQFYAEVQAGGGGRWDTSSLLTRLPD
jgi:3-hydroxyisobutyrate dehydrogenase